jgi:outer membrane protein
MKFWYGAALVAALPLLSHAPQQRPNDPVPSNVPVLTVDDAIGIAEHNAFSLKNAASSVEIAHQQVNAAKGGLGPQLSANVSYSQIISHSNFANAGALEGLSTGGSTGTTTTTGTTTGTTAGTTGATATSTGTTGATATTTGTTGGTTGTTAGTTGTTSGTTGSTTTTGSSIAASASSLSLFSNTQEGTLSLSLPIDISGTIRSGVRAAQAAYRASRNNFAAADNDLRQNVRQSYFTILEDKAQLKVSQDTVRNAQDTLKNAQLKLNAGTLARYDVLQYETQLSQAQSDLITAENNLEVAKENFNDVLARPIDTAFDVQDVVTLPTVSRDVKELTAAALTNRPDVLALQATIEAYKYNRKSTEASMDPSMAFGAQHIRLFDPGSLTTEFYENSAFLSVTVPIFDSGITRARVKEIRQQEEQIKNQLAQLQLGISLEVRQDLSNLQSAQAKLDVAQKQVEQASEAYRLAVVRANAGESTTLDVTNAQTQLTTAETGLVNARYAYLIDYAALQRAIDEDGAKVPPITAPRAR